MIARNPLQPIRNAKERIEGRRALARNARKLGSEDRQIAALEAIAMELALIQAELQVRRESQAASAGALLHRDPSVAGLADQLDPARPTAPLS